MQIKTLAAACGFVVLGAAAAALACPYEQQTQSASLPTVSVQQVASWIAHKKAVVCDANGPDTRHHLGVVPGAVLLSHYRNYNVQKELPKDKTTQLVFYCYNEQCLAAPTAAAVAHNAGYKNVAVMRAGIMGWIAAGKHVQDLPPNT